MRVFLTGGTGFVGSSVLPVLLARGHEVHVLLRPGSEASHLLHPNAKIVRGDLFEPSSYEGALSKIQPEGCVHLGGYTEPADYLSAGVNAEHLRASAALAAHLVDLGCERFVAAGTCIEYDVRKPGPFGEDAPLLARHWYAACKSATRNILTQITAGTGTSLAWARLFFLYGPRERKNRLVRSVIESLLSGGRARVSTGEAIRDFSHVADVAAGIVHVLEHEELTGSVNVASGKPTPVHDVVRTVSQILIAEDRVDWGSNESSPLNEAPSIVADVSKLAESGFVPAFDLESGLRDTIAWVKENQ